MACGCCGKRYKPTANQPTAQAVRVSRFRRRTGAVNGIIRAGTAPVVPASTPPPEEVAPVVEENKE